jgi:hypothetical protein
LLFNWNLLGDGVHTVRALADGVEFARVTFTVTTLGLGEFARGLSGNALVTDFPQAGTSMRLQWQESQQNFLLSGALPAGVNANQCVTQAADATDASGATASLSWSNPCLLAAGNAMLLAINNALAGTTAAALRAQTDPSPFFACDRDLRIVQGNRVFDASQFDWLDPVGGRVCQEVAPGRSLETFIRVRPGVPLNFNDPFQAFYVGRLVIAFPAISPEPPPISPEPPHLAAEPDRLDFGKIPPGGRSTRDVIVTNVGGGILEGQVALTLDRGTSGPPVPFSLSSGDSLRISVTINVPPNTTPGPFGGVVTITSNGGSKEIPVSGTVDVD